MSVADFILIRYADPLNGLTAEIHENTRFYVLMQKQVFLEKVFLEISQNSHKNTCTRVFF